MVILVSFLVCILSQLSFASQEAIVRSEKAIIYSDERCTSPIGFLSLGKKIKIGDIPRNKGRSRSLVINKKIVYIREIDLSFDDLSGSSRFELQRFKEIEQQRSQKYYGLSYLAGSMSFSQVSSYVQSKSINYNGVGFNFHTDINKSWGFNFQADYLIAEKASDKFKFIDLAFHVPYLIVNQEFFRLSFGPTVVGVPFAQYGYMNKFRTNSGGFGGGLQSGISFNLFSSLRLSLYYDYLIKKIGKFDTPEENGFKEFAPWVKQTGIRASLLYTF